MHFHSLAVVQIPAIKADPEYAQKHAEIVAEAERVVTASPDDFMAKFYLRQVRRLNSRFAVELEDAVDTVMAPYNQEITEYTEQAFEDQTSDIAEEYNHGCGNFIRTPDGRLQPLRYPLNRRFIIKDGLVYEQDVGKLKLEKRTHIAKKMKAYPSYPYKKVYPTLHDFAIQHGSYEFDEEHNAFGYYYNPNSMWDWYEIGGRWPVTFLVKNTCEEYALGVRSWGDESEEYAVPEGYKWVSAARKKDIEWQAMHDWYVKTATEHFNALESMFVAGIVKPGPHLTVRDGKVFSYINHVYTIGESLEDYLSRHLLNGQRKYPVSFCDLISEDDWITVDGEHSFADLSKEDEESACDQIDSFLDDLDDEDVLVSIDYHC